MILTALVSLATSFIGSFACFVLWVHFDLEDHWDDRKLARGRKIENQQRKLRGLPPV